MDETTVRAMLQRHFENAGKDPVAGHDMYVDDAVLEFPQSGERFVGVENLREWRTDYPASTTVEYREIRGRDDFWVAEIARESIYVAEGWEPPAWRARWRAAP